MSAKSKRKEAGKATLIAIYKSLDLISGCFPDGHYRLYREDLITKKDFIDEVLLCLHRAVTQSIGYDLFISVNEPLTLSTADYDRVYDWISKTPVYQKSATWYKGGVRSDSDIVKMIQNIYVKSLETYKNLLEAEDKAAAQMVALGIRNIVDFSGIMARNEEELIYQGECKRLEQGGYLAKGQ